MRESMSRLLVYGNGTDHPLRDCDHESNNSDLLVPGPNATDVRRDVRLKFDALAIAWEQVPGQLEHGPRLRLPVERSKTDQ